MGGIECLIGIKFNDFVVLATDMSKLWSIMKIKGDADKMQKLSSHLVMAICGEAGDTTQFGEYIEKNVQLYKMRNGYELPPSAAVHFTRNTLANHLRSREPYMVNSLVAGYDPEEKTPELFYMDYLAAAVPVNYYAYGYGGTFPLAIMDQLYRPDMNEKEAIELVEKCCEEISRRFLANLNKFRVRIVNTDGIKDMPHISVNAEVH